MATFNTAFGSLAKDMKMQAGVPGSQQAQAQAQGQPSGQPQGTPEQRRQQARQAQQAAGAPTFSQMQQQGRARPAPQETTAAQRAMGYEQGLGAPSGPVEPLRLAPTTPATPATAAPTAPNFLNQLNQQVQTLQQAPSVFSTPEMQQIRAAQMANINAEFGAQRSMLQEELARRGLADSTIAGGRYGDLAGQQARAVAGVDAELLQQSAQAEQQRQDQILSALTTGTQAEATKTALSEDVRQFDISQALQQTIGLGELDTKKKALNQELTIAEKEITARADLLAKQITADAAAQGKTISAEKALQQARVTAESELQKKQLEQAQTQFNSSLAFEEKQFLQAKHEFAKQFRITEREMDLGEAELDAQKRQFKRAQDLKGLAFSEQLALDKEQMNLSKREQVKREEQFAAIQSQEWSQFSNELELKRDAIEDAREQFDASLDEESRQFNEDLVARQSEAYSRYAGRVFNTETNAWEDTVQREIAEGELQVSQKRLLLDLAEVLAGAGGAEGISKSQWSRLSKILNQADPDSVNRDPDEGEDPDPPVEPEKKKKKREEEETTPAVVEEDDDDDNRGTV